MRVWGLGLGSPARILRGSLASQRGNVVCVARGHAALTALCEFMRKRCGPIVWRGSCAVIVLLHRSLKKSLESREKSSIGRARSLFYCIVYAAALCVARVHEGPAQVPYRFKDAKNCLRGASPLHRSSEARGRERA